MPLTKLTLQVGDEKVSWEITKEDCSAIKIVEGLYSVMLGATYCRESILSAMSDFVEEYEE